MHTVELLEEALEVARELGFEVRHEWLGGGGGGACEFGGRKCLFVDLSLNSLEQLDQVSEALQCDPAIYLLSLSREMRRQLGIQLSA